MFHDGFWQDTRFQEATGMLYLSKPSLIAVRPNFRGLHRNILLHNLSKSKADLICVHSTTDCGHLMNSTLDSFNKT